MMNKTSTSNSQKYANRSRAITQNAVAPNKKKAFTPNRIKATHSKCSRCINEDTAQCTVHDPAKLVYV